MAIRAGRLVRPFVALVPAVVLGLAAASSPMVAAAPRIKAGVFLYAAPSLGDPNFLESVVLLLQHGPEGSMGLIVNRPTKVSVREAVPDLAEIRGLELRLHQGGPVQPDVALALIRSPRRLPDAEQVLPDVQLSTDPKQWKKIASEPEVDSRLRIYSGYAGWAPGQLAKEMSVRAWIVAPADARSVFSSDPDTLWPRVHDLMRRIEARGGHGP
jgi:putative transcriptional regulator